MPSAKKAVETPESNRAAVEDKETRASGHTAAPSKPKPKGSDRVAVPSIRADGTPDQSEGFVTLTEAE